MGVNGRAWFSGHACVHVSMCKRVHVVVATWVHEGKRVCMHACMCANNVCTRLHVCICEGA